MNILIFLAIILVLGVTYLYQRREFRITGRIFGHYPWSYRAFMAPVYEEIMFRWLLIWWLSQYVSLVYVVGFSSLLFALWHLKNYPLQPVRVTVGQVLYAGLIIDPVLALVSIWYGNILPAILLHALNNLFAPMTQKWLNRRRL